MVGFDDHVVKVYTAFEAITSEPELSLGVSLACFARCKHNLRHSRSFIVLVCTANVTLIRLMWLSSQRQ